MKTLFFTTLLLLLTYGKNTLAAEDFGVQYYKESGLSENTTENIQGFSLISQVKLCEGIIYCQVGLSFSEIKSTQYLNDLDAKKVYPLYFFAKYVTPAVISPFVEAGIDFGSLLIQQNIDKDTGLYGSIGLRFSPIKYVSISAYYKHYRLAYYRDDNSPNEEHRSNQHGATTIDLIGASAAIYF